MKAEDKAAIEADATFASVVVGGIATIRASRADLMDLLVRDHRDVLAGRRKRPRTIFDSNGQGISLAARDPEYRSALQAADLVHSDSQWIVFASRLLTRRPIPEKSTTTDMFFDAATVASEHGLAFYMLGATEQTNVRAAANLRRDYPNLRIAGRRHGYFAENEEAEICRAINASGADIVWVGLGKPKEQLFCVRNRDRIKATWLVTCGGCFKIVAGELPRAPVWVQHAGFEWLYRLAARPSWEILRRYLATNPHALYLLLTRTGRDG